MATEVEKREQAYNKLLEKYQSMREEVVQAKRALDEALDRERADAALSAAGLEVVDGVVRLKTISAEASVNSLSDQDEEDED